MKTKEVLIPSLSDIPVAPLGIVALEGSKELAALVDQHIVARRRDFMEKNPGHVSVEGYLVNSFLIPTKCLRFANGEGKAVINETVRGYDIFIMADIGNYSCKYKMFETECPMSPDNHFQDIKRTISALGGKSRRITVIMPMLYEGRQHKRQSRESLDCAIALQELEKLGVDNIITFDAHDPRVQNAIPLIGFENLLPTYQIIKALLEKEIGLELRKSGLLVISPDEGAMPRSLYYANILGLDISLFYKSRDYTRLENGRNPIVHHEFLGEGVAGKDIFIVDDMISSGESILEIARELKRRKARRIFIAVTFALFTEGLKEFNSCYQNGIINRVYATNLTYRKEELKSASWFVEVDMSDFIASLIDKLNLDHSISPLFDPSEKIAKLVRDYHTRSQEQRVTITG